MLHQMKLRMRPYNMIQNGSKTIEMRLWDEKRQTLQVGDEIEFYLCDTKGKTALDRKPIRTRIIQLHRFDCFEALYSKLPIDKLGYEEVDIPNASARDMELYYTKEQQQLYGVVGIEIELIN